MADRQKVNGKGRLSTVAQNIRRHKITASCGIHLESTLSAMEETRFKKKHSRLIRRLTNELNFTYNEVESILLIYFKFQRSGPVDQKGMTRKQFENVLHDTFDITDAEMAKRVIRSFCEAGSTTYFSMEAWAKALSLFLRGTLKEKISFCYSVYTADVVTENRITQKSMNYLLANSLIGEDDDEDAVRDLTQVLVNKMDKDRDGKLSYKDFKNSVLEEPILLEALGQCLPSRMTVHAFITTFSQYVGNV